MISIMKPIVCKYRVILNCESISYEVRANQPTVASVPMRAIEPAGYQINSLRGWVLT